MATNWVKLAKEYTEVFDGRLLRISKLIWQNGGHSFEVSLIEGDREVDIPLTIDGALDDSPTDEQLRILLEEGNVARARAYMSTDLAEA